MGVSRSEDLRKIWKQGCVAAIVPGVFRDSSRAERVYFVEEISGAANMVATCSSARTSTRSWRDGRATRLPGDAENGDRFWCCSRPPVLGDPGTPEYRLYEFERYASGSKSRGARPSADDETMATADLISEPSPRHLGASWRIGLPMSALVLSLLAVPLSL